MLPWWLCQQTWLKNSLYSYSSMTSSQRSNSENHFLVYAARRIVPFSMQGVPALIWTWNCRKK
jgi:hypothetical protein